MSATITVWFYDYCANNSGLWTRVYAETEAAARAERRRRLRSFCITERDLAGRELCGEYGDVTPIEAVTVELTPAGVVDALNNADPN